MAAWQHGIMAGMPGYCRCICFGDACFRDCPDPAVPQRANQITPLRGFIITYTCFLFLFLILLLLLFLKMSHVNMAICEHVYMNRPAPIMRPLQGRDLCVVAFYL